MNGHTEEHGGFSLCEVCYRLARKPSSINPKGTEIRPNKKAVPRPNMQFPLLRARNKLKGEPDSHGARHLYSGRQHTLSSTSSSLVRWPRCTAGVSAAYCASRKHHPGSSPWNFSLHQGALPSLLPGPAVPFTQLPTMPAGTAGSRKLLLERASNLSDPKPGRLFPEQPFPRLQGKLHASGPRERVK